jgi:hypothetical protein
MKWFKCLVIMSTVLAFSFGAHADTVWEQASGTSDYSISFKTMAQGFAVFAASNPITIYAYAGGTAVDTMTVEAGNSKFFYCPANRLSIDRTLATAVTINATFNNNILPNLGSNVGAITALVGAPTPVTVSESNVFTGLTLNHRSVGSATNLKAAAYRTFPVTAGIDVHGAKALYLVIDWTDWKHGGFTVQHKFSPSATDTSFYYYDGATWASADTVSLTDSTGALLNTPRGVAGSVMLRIPDVPGAGYYFCKITAPLASARDTIGPINGTLVKVE